MSAFELVNQFKTLASNPSNRGTIVKEQGCLPALILFLDNQEDKGFFSSFLFYFFESRYLESHYLYSLFHSCCNSS